jgi:transposase
VPDSDRICPQCSGTKFHPLGPGKESFTFDYVPGYFRRRRHIRETLACSCGAHVVTAPGPDHSVEGARYGDGFRAYVVVSKCADSMPLYRLAKQLSRLGIPIPRSTLTDLFHQVARALAPLSERLVQLGGRLGDRAGRRDLPQDAEAEQAGLRLDLPRREPDRVSLLWRPERRHALAGAGHVAGHLGSSTCTPGTTP